MVVLKHTSTRQNKFQTHLNYDFIMNWLKIMVTIESMEI